MNRPHPVPSIVPTNIMLKLLVAGAMIAAYAPVHAAYTVMDDDLYPTSYIEARDTRQSSHAKKSAPFARQRSILGPAGRAALDAMIPEMRNAATIRIVGRPDAMPSGDLAGDRAISTRNYLVQKGIPQTAIKMEIDESPNPQRNGSIYPIDIYITAANSDRAYAQHRYSEEPQYAPAQTAPVMQSAVQPQSAANAELIRQINNSVANGSITSSVALKLLANLNSSNPKWEILATDQTLQNTFARWAKMANWQVKWQGIPDIRNPGHVTLPDGDFLATANHVLKEAQRAAKAAGMPLSVKAYPNRVLVISKAAIK